MTSTTARVTAAAVGLLLTASLAGCGSSEEKRYPGATATASSAASDAAAPAEASASPTEQSSAEEWDEELSQPGLDPSQPGDELLDGTTWGAVFRGTDAKLEWRFPTSYDDQKSQQASTTGSGPTYKLAVGLKLDTSSAREAESLRDGAGPMGRVAIGELSIGDKDVSSVETDTSSGSFRAYFWTPDGSRATYAVLSTAIGAERDEVPEKRLDEIYQTVASLTVAPR